MHVDATFPTDLSLIACKNQVNINTTMDNSGGKWCYCYYDIFVEL